MKITRILGLGALLFLAPLLRSAELATDLELLSIRGMASEGKLAHALRALDHGIEKYPADPRLPALKAQLTEELLRNMPAPRPLAPAPLAARPPVPTEQSPTAGRNFVCGTAHVVMIWIPAGTFFMSATLGSDDDTWVTFSRGYWLGQTEVTQEQWQGIIEEDPFPFHFKGSDRPAEWISWVSAMKFCDRLTARERAAGRLAEGYEYSLPTEAQWEYACRAGSTEVSLQDLDSIAWYERNSGLQTHPVAQKRPNAWGLYDMLGNVYEWCFDSYAGYPGGHVTDPRREDAAPSAGAPRMIRGGAGGSSAGECRPGHRYRMSINYTGAGVGFRVALVPQVRPPAASADRPPGNSR